MCRPPDLTPSPGGIPEGDGFEFVADGAEDWSNGSFEAGDFDGATSDLVATSVLGKRNMADDVALANALSRSAKMQRAVAPVSSAFNTAAATFVARMEQSMLQDLQKEQQQRQLAAAVAEGQEALLLQKALLERRAKIQQLQQLQLLKQLKQQEQVNCGKTTVIPEQQQLLLAQQQLLQQSQAKLLNAMTPVAQPPPAAWASIIKQQQQAASAASLLDAANELSGQSTIPLQWIQGNTPVAASSAFPAAPLGKVLPSLQPKPATSVLGAAATGVELSAAALYGLGSICQPNMRPSVSGFSEEKKHKRMLSNRASAKRSRQRRQARLVELDKATALLQDENSVVCAKLEQAQQEIQALEDKNRSLCKEVAHLRKLLGLEVQEGVKKCEPEQTVSGIGEQYSCLDSEGCNMSAAQKAVKGKVEHCSIEDEEEEEDEDEDEECGAGGDGDSSLDWLGNMPLSPSSGFIAGDDQLLVQGDALSELLACFEG